MAGGRHDRSVHAPPRQFRGPGEEEVRLQGGGGARPRREREQGTREETRGARGREMPVHAALEVGGGAVAARDGRAGDPPNLRGGTEVIRVGVRDDDEGQPGWLLPRGEDGIQDAIGHAEITGVHEYGPLSLEQVRVHGAEADGNDIGHTAEYRPSGAVGARR